MPQESFGGWRTENAQQPSSSVRAGKPDAATINAQPKNKSLFERLVEWLPKSIGRIFAQWTNNATIEIKRVLSSAEINKASTVEGLVEVLGPYFDGCIRDSINPELSEEARKALHDKLHGTMGEAGASGTQGLMNQDASAQIKSLLALAQAAKTKGESLAALSLAYTAQAENPGNVVLEKTLTKDLLQGLEKAIGDKACDLTGEPKSIFENLNCHLLEHASENPLLGVNGKPDISRKEVWHMALLQQLSKKPEGEATPLSSKLSALAANFVQNAIGNKKLNAALTLALKRAEFQEGGEAAGLMQVFQDMRTLTFKTQGIQGGESISEATQALQDLNTKTQAAINWKEGDAALPEANKLTLRELHTLQSLHSLPDIINKYQLQDLHVGAETQEAANYFKTLSEVTANYKVLDEALLKEFNTSGLLENGTILARDLTKQVMGGLDDQLDRLFDWFVMGKGHPEVVVKGQGGTIMKSGNTDKVHLEPLNTAFLLSNHIFTVNTDKLINAETQETLIKLYESDWETQVAALYREAEAEIHQNEARFSGIINHIGIQIKAGIAHFLFGWLPGNKQTADSQRALGATIAQGEAYGEKNPTEMICSAFVARTKVAALYILEQKLQAKLAESMEAEPADADFAQQATRKMQFVNFPFNEAKDFDNVIPPALYDHLQHAGVITLVDPKDPEKGYPSRVQHCINFQGSRLQGI